MTLNENVNSAADEQKAKLQDCKAEAELADGVAGEGVALSDEDLEQVSGGSNQMAKTLPDLPSIDPLVPIDVPTDPTKVSNAAQKAL